MISTPSPTNKAVRRGSLMLPAALLVTSLLSLSVPGYAQNPNAKEKTPTSPPVNDQEPLANDERAELLKLIRSLQDRVEKLEAAQPTASPLPSTANPTGTTATGTTVSAVAKDAPPASSVSPDAPTKSQDSDDKNFDGRYTPNLGFRVANTECGDMNISIYTYIRYLNQLDLNSNYTDAFGNTKSVQRRKTFNF